MSYGFPAPPAALELVCACLVASLLVAASLVAASLVARRVAQAGVVFPLLAIAAVAMLSACVVINSTSDPALAPQSAPAEAE